jgi:hypothetical protein
LRKGPGRVGGFPPPEPPEIAAQPPRPARSQPRGAPRPPRGSLGRFQPCREPPPPPPPRLIRSVRRSPRLVPLVSASEDCPSTLLNGHALDNEQSHIGPTVAPHHDPPENAVVKFPMLIEKCLEGHCAVPGLGGSSAGSTPENRRAATPGPRPLDRLHPNPGRERPGGIGGADQTPRQGAGRERRQRAFSAMIPSGCIATHLRWSPPVCRYFSSWVAIRPVRPGDGHFGLAQSACEYP